MTSPQQRIGFCTVGDRRVAYAVVGEGPPLVMPAWWFSHLEVDWQHPGVRAFLSALAEHHTVIRYDRPGTGLSDRDGWTGVPSLDMEVDTLEAVLDEAGVEDLSVFGMSCGGCIAAGLAQRHPERLRRVVFYGCFGDGSGLGPPGVRAAMVSAVRAHWGLGSRLITEVFLPTADAAERRFFIHAQRTSASSRVAGDLLEFTYGCCVTDALVDLRAPALVLHRRNDRAVPYELGRRLAGLVPGARFVPLEGDVHVPWLGHSRPVVEATLAFLEEKTDAPAVAGPASNGPPGGGLTPRECEVLRLVAAGMADEQIADALIVSPHTVHRHVANIRAKLRQPTRAAAAVEAMRRGLI